MIDQQAGIDRSQPGSLVIARAGVEAGQTRHAVVAAGNVMKDGRAICR